LKRKFWEMSNAVWKGCSHLAFEMEGEGQVGGSRRVFVGLRTKKRDYGGEGRGRWCKVGNSGRRTFPSQEGGTEGVWFITGFQARENKGGPFKCLHNRKREMKNGEAERLGDRGLRGKIPKRGEQSFTPVRTGGGKKRGDWDM